MAKLVIETKKTPQKNDILVYNGIEWECISKNEFLANTHKQLGECLAECESLKKDLDSTKKQVNQKLKEYHDILRVQTKGE